MNKFRNTKSNGFDSKLEERRAQELLLLQKCGEIHDLKLQVPFELIPKQEGERAVKYIADFTFIKNGVLHVQDVKSSMTRKLPAYIIKRKLMLWVHGIKIEEVY